MKKIRLCVSFAFVFLVIINSVLSDISAKELVFATDDTPGPPYIIGGGTEFNWEKPGIEVEIYKLLEKKLGLTIKFIRVPWARCLKYLELGQVDGIFPASYKKERMKLGVYPMKNEEPDPGRKTRDNAYYLYTVKDADLKWDGEVFSNVQGAIGAPIGWAIVSTLKEQGVKVEELPDPVQLLNMLIYGRLDGIACLETVLDVYLQEEPVKYSNIVKVSPPLLEKPYYLMLSHQFVNENPELAEKIWNTIAEIKQSDDFRKLVSKYRQ